MCVGWDMGVFLLILFVFSRSFRFDSTPFYPSLHFHSPSVRFQFFMNVPVRVDFFWPVDLQDRHRVHHPPERDWSSLPFFLIAVFFGGVWDGFAQQFF